MKKLTSVALVAAAFVTFATPAHAATSFTVDVAPTVGVTSTIDASAVVPWNASVTTSVQWRSPGCCGAMHVLLQLGRTPVTHWTPQPLDATREYVIVLVDVGVPNPVNHLVKHTTYAQAFVVGQPIVIEAPVTP